MIEKNIDILSIKDLCIQYKENYNPIISEFTNIYKYSTNNIDVAFLIFDVIYDRCEIIDIFTAREYRGNGIAKKLIDEITNDFDIKNITLEVRIDNISAVSLYEKMGFKSCAIRKGYYNGIDGILMIKEVR